MKSWESSSFLVIRSAAVLLRDMQTAIFYKRSSLVNCDGRPYDFNLRLAEEYHTGMGLVSEIL